MNLIYIVLFIFLSVNLFIFFYLKWYIKRRTTASGLLPEYRNEVYRLIAEIDAVTDRDSLLVEERIKKLKEILDDTDRRISVYVKELEKSRAGEALYTNLGRGIRAALKTESESAPPLSSIRPDIEVIHEVSKKPVVHSPPPVQPEQNTDRQKSPSKRQIRSSIDLLANEGLPPEEIASRLDISIAEVDLAMNLRKRNK